MEKKKKKSSATATWQSKLIQANSPLLCIGKSNLKMTNGCHLPASDKWCNIPDHLFCLDFNWSFHLANSHLGSKRSLSSKAIKQFPLILLTVSLSYNFFRNKVKSLRSFSLGSIITSKDFPKNVVGGTGYAAHPQKMLSEE